MFGTADRLLPAGRRSRSRSPAISLRRRSCKLLGTPGDAAPLALAYLRVIFLAMPALLLLTLLMMALRGCGRQPDAACGS